MRQLKYLDISNTDINEVDVSKLPSSLEVIIYSTELRPDCKLVNIVLQLKGYDEHSLCQKCGQVKTSKN